LLVLYLVPVMLSLLLLTAHFVRRGGMVVVVAILCLAGLLVIRRAWATRMVQGALLLGCLEWLRTLSEPASLRIELGQPVVRLLLILGAVTGLTGASALIFKGAKARAWFRIGS
jgi:hypothetical protein